MINTKRMYFVNILMEILPNAGLQKFKAKLFRWAGVKVGNNVEFFQGVKIQGVGEVEIGDGAFIGHEVFFMINKGGKIDIGESSVISSRCTIITGFHPITPNGERIISVKEPLRKCIFVKAVLCLLVVWCCLGLLLVRRLWWPLVPLLQIMSPRTR